MAKTNHRSAKTGKFVTEKYAKSHPATTVKETNKTPPKNGSQYCLCSGIIGKSFGINCCFPPQ